MKESSVTIPLRSFPKTIDPTNMGQVDSFRVGKLLSDGLFALGKNLEVTNVVAERVEWSDDQLELNIKIKDIQFSDGTPVSSNDVVRAIERCVRKTEEFGTESLKRIVGYKEFIDGKAKTMSGVKEINSKNLSIKLNGLAGLLLNDLADNSCFLIKEGPGGTLDFLKGAIGVGPYKISSIEDSKEIKIVKREDFPYENNGPDVVYFKVADNFGSFDKMKDKFDLIVLDDYVENIEDFNSYAYSPIGSLQLIVNCTRAPFNDLEVRKALFLALDGYPFHDKLGWPLDEFQESIIPFGVAGFQRREKFGSVNEAEAILRKKGFSENNPLSFQIFISKGTNTDVEAKIWSTVAFPSKLIQVQAKEVIFGDIWDDFVAKKFDAVRLTRYPGSTEAHKSLSAFLSSSPFNFSGFKS
ncbi:MAG: hypothetical protein KDD25_07840, partial [Bdellovibrionales bacterium]|nr:hypothetical protein [Bdellovibrionales bacterium]